MLVGRKFGKLKRIGAIFFQRGVRTFSFPHEKRLTLDSCKRLSQPDALVPLPDPMLFAEGKRIADFGAKSRLPTIGAYREFAEAGGLMSYGNNPAESYKRAATYVDKILKGAKPGDLPIEQPTQFELVVNLKTAKLLGITLPQSVLLRADKVIQ